MKNTSRKYRAIIPFIPDMGSVSPTIVTESAWETKSANLLWSLNHMRDHDGLPRLTRLPRGVKWERVKQ